MSSTDSLRAGVEITYPLYNPTVQSIEVLRLERRLDDDLRYLRDSPLEYSTVPLDMEPDLAADAPVGGVPLNDIKVSSPGSPDRRFVTA